ncbi:MAG TPA: ferrochelatase [Candidatus Baltobacteraceae bacterium]|nr:ferrochelatase [Candidatus Baltobacteraceae bacterium]
MTAQTIVLLGFGGPSGPDEIRPFLDRVLQGRRIPAERYETVVSHYMHMGGKSPFNELTQRQAEALERELHARHFDASVRTAYINAAPFVSDVAVELQHDGEQAPIAVILAAHQSPASWDKYLDRIPGAVYVPPYFEHPLFVTANAERVRDALQRFGKDSFDGVELIFTAHSIPQAMADASPYVAQLHRSAELIAQHAGAVSWRVAYQSRSGSPKEPWLAPDVRDVLRALPQQNVREAIVAPVGFLCDHVEVLYDLDVDAAAAAKDAGVRMERASALNDHPLFIRMLADLVQQCAA